MSYTIKSFKIFEEQVRKLDKKSKNIVFNKIQLLKENPYRYKKIHSKLYSRVFRIRFSLQNKDMRLIYVVIEPNIILVCFIERKKDYKDLEKYLKKLKNFYK